MSHSEAWGICTPRAGKLCRARSRLYRSRFLQPNIRWKALAEIYKMHSFAPLSTFNFFPKIAEILLIFIEILLHFAKILQYFDEISLEFCRDLPGENAPASGSSREFLRVPGSSCEFPGVPASFPRFAAFGNSPQPAIPRVS